MEQKADQPIVRIELSPAGRNRLFRQINDRRATMADDVMVWDFGFILPDHDLGDEADEITLAQLVVIAAKLKMSLIISDNGIDLSPMNGETDGR